MLKIAAGGGGGEGWGSREENRHQLLSQSWLSSLRFFDQDDHALLARPLLTCPWLVDYRHN